MPQLIVHVERRLRCAERCLMLSERRAVQITDCFAVVGELRQVELVIDELDSRRDAEIARRAPFKLHVWLCRRGVELFMEVGKGGIDPGARIGRRLEAIGLRELIPESGTE